MIGVTRTGTTSTSNKVTLMGPSLISCESGIDEYHQLMAIMATSGVNGPAAASLSYGLLANRGSMYTKACCTFNFGESSLSLSGVIPMTAYWIQNIAFHNDMLKHKRSNIRGE